MKKEEMKEEMKKEGGKKLEKEEKETNLALIRGGYFIILAPCLAHSPFTLSFTFLHNSNNLKK